MTPVFDIGERSRVGSRTVSESLLVTILAGLLANACKVLDKLDEAAKAISLPEADTDVITQFVDLLVTPTHGDM